MATTFLEPGGDADFGFGLWTSPVAVTATIVSDIVHGSHQRSIRGIPDVGGGTVVSTSGILADTGSRLSFYIYISALPAATSSIVKVRNAARTQNIFSIRLTNAGVLQIWNGVANQIGIDGSALSTGTWYRISLAYTITNGTTNEFRLFKDAISDISITNATLSQTASSCFFFANSEGDTSFDSRYSDIYVDNSSSLTDPGNIWVTAKRPNANGTTNGFNTQIGAGGSGYGTGHSPQVNERPSSNTNGWSVVNAGSTVTEEYNIESTSTGDINISGFTIIDYMGWVVASSVTNENASIIVNNVTSAISLTSSATFFTKIAGSSSYPAGTGTDIGIITDATVTTVGLYECGIVVAYIPVTATARVATKFLTLLGVG